MVPHGNNSDDFAVQFDCAMQRLNAIAHSKWPLNPSEGSATDVHPLLRFRIVEVGNDLTLLSAEQQLPTCRQVFGLADPASPSEASTSSDERMVFFDRLSPTPDSSAIHDPPPAYDSIVPSPRQVPLAVIPMAMVPMVMIPVAVVAQPIVAVAETIPEPEDDREAEFRLMMEELDRLELP